jgi:prepilin-type N-terminal cleavage/methylation domain-containing protein
MRPPTSTSLPPHRTPAFTLIELLVVIAVISILASMMFPIGKALNRIKMKGRAKAEMTQIETAIQSYKAKLGTFPPDNPATPVINQLYYELSGTTVTNTGGNAKFYLTLDGNSQLSADTATFQSYFGSRVTGFMNTTRGAGDEGVFAVNFLKGSLRPDQVAILPSGAKVLVTTLRWPEGQAYHPVSGTGFKTVNPWRYNSSNPTNNPGSYDLWVDVIIDGKTNRFGNWSKEPVLVSKP